MKFTAPDPPRIRPEVAAKLGYYIYAYLDPRTNRIFYVGKGCRKRALAHLDDVRQSKKTTRIIRALKRINMSPQIDIISHGMDNEETALRVEAALIDVLQPYANLVRGVRALQFGRTPLAELEAQYAATPVIIKEPAILIRVNRLYRPAMSKKELYEATRGVWKLGKRRNGARYAFAIYQGVVRQVYKIRNWHPAGTTQYETRAHDDVNAPGRWEFTGAIASGLASRYRNRSVRRYFQQNCQNPIVYINC